MLNFIFQHYYEVNIVYLYYAPGGQLYLVNFQIIMSISCVGRIRQLSVNVAL